MTHKPTFRRQGIDYLGFLEAKLRDLQGLATLVYELIQNADDAPGATSVVFDIRDDALEVSNDGVFRDVDFERMQKVAGSGKREEQNTTGAFGIGFISVYQITDRPELISADRHWIFRPEETEERRIEERRIKGPGGTRFRLPWAFDPDSQLRRRLRVQAIRNEDPDHLVEELSYVLPGGLLFLRKLVRVELRRNGETLRNLERIVEEGQVVLQDGTHTRLWHLFPGDFAAKAEQLRAEFGDRIEAKRSRSVTIAVPEGAGDEEGVLCAYLPTQHRTGLTFHVNADFFTSSDRKRVLFGDDYQGRWNTAAVGGASLAVAGALPRLPELLGHASLWKLLDHMQDVARKAEVGQREKAFGEFWKAVLPELSKARIVFSSKEEWHRPANVFLLEKEEEHKALPLLESMGVLLVHPDLRPHFGLLRSADLGVRLLGVRELAEALGKSGLDRTRALDEAPEWIRPAGARELLAREIETLFERKMTDQNRQEARQAVSAVAIALGQDGRLHPPRDLYKADIETMALFRGIGVETPFLANGNPKAIDEMAPSFDTAAALDALGACEPEMIEALWRAGGWTAHSLIRWIEARKASLSPGLRDRFVRLPIFPSGKRLRHLTDLAVPGTFDDPLGLASLVDLEKLPDLRDFLRELGAQELTFSTYVRQQIPQAFAVDGGVTTKSRRKLVMVLAEHLGEIRDDDDSRIALAMCPLVECQDGRFRTAGEVYVGGLELLDVLGHETPLAVNPREHPQAVRELLLWLGVAESPRPADLLTRVRRLTQLPPARDVRMDIQKVFAHLAGRWKQEASALENELVELQSLAWLPTFGDESSWRRPADLYATYQSYLFETQAQFLDVERTVQNQAPELIRWLGIRIEPTASQVVRHLLACAEAGRKVNPEVYRFLNDHIADNALRSLRDNACLLLPDGRYVRPDQVFWSEHPFGRYRVRFGADMRRFGELFERLGVRELPEPEDARRVLEEISQEFGDANRPLDEGAQGVVHQCWVLLSRALEDERIEPDDLGELRDRKVIPDDRRLLNPPRWMFFEDRPGLASRFGAFLDHNAIPRPQGAWRAMQAAGVRPLSQAVRTELIECEDPEDDEAVRKLLSDRWVLIERVVEAARGAERGTWDLSILDQLPVKRATRLEVRRILETFGQVRSTEPEAVPVHFDRLERVLYYADRDGGPPWAALSREIAYAMNPEAEAGQVAPGLKEALSAVSLAVATAELDELGYAPFKEVAPAGPAQELVQELGETTPDDVASPQLPPAVSGPSTPEEALRALLGQKETTPTPPPRGLDRQEHERGEGAIGRSTSRQPSASGSGTSQRSRLRSYVTPEGATSEPEDDSEAAACRSRLDRAGVNRVLDHERRAGRRPVEMPPNHPGYDVESRDDSGMVERYIEVKSLAGEWGGLGAGLTRTQFERGRKLGERYWLYVVEYADQENVRIVRIQDPARRVGEFFYDDGWRDLAEPAPRNESKAADSETEG